MNCRILKLSILALCSYALFITNAQADYTIAFGFLKNQSANVRFNYLETIFPNSFASSVAHSGLEVKRPLNIDEHLKKNYDVKLKKFYEYFELPGLIEKIDADLFIYGRFIPYPDRRIKIVLHLYLNETNEIYTFTNIGRMETEIFKLVDRISAIVINILNKQYKIQKIHPGARLAILTNIGGEELNNLYLPFLKKGYLITCFQGNDNINPLHYSVSKFNRFRYITTRDNSYDKVTDIRKVKLYRGTWTGGEYNKKVNYIKDIYKKYELNYIKLKYRILERFNSTFNGKIDYLFIIGFNKGRDNAWLRCINIRKRNLIWVQSNISGSQSKITDYILNYMLKVSESPLKKK